MKSPEKDSHKNPQESLQPEQHVESIIVKIWVEETSGDLTSKAWRGHITRVASGERSYVKSLEEITQYFDILLMKLCDGRENI